MEYPHLRLRHAFRKGKTTEGQISPFADFDWYMRKRYKIAKHIQTKFLNQINKLRTNR